MILKRVERLWEVRCDRVAARRRRSRVPTRYKRCLRRDTPTQKPSLVS
ncbi:MAG: hypothetical protein KME55_09315 [Nostoc indistinguendum CM1-VF10]|nr:hypothetical protein [Nostoc indistinguendum CM1-VF10]